MSSSISDYFHELADFGCSWRKWLPLFNCLQYAWMAFRRCGRPASSFLCSISSSALERCCSDWVGSDFMLFGSVKRPFVFRRPSVFVCVGSASGVAGWLRPHLCFRQPLAHPLTRSLAPFLILSGCKSLTQSLTQPLTQSLRHSVTESLSH